MLLGAIIFVFYRELPGLVFFPVNRIISETSQAGGFILFISGMQLASNLRELRYLRHRRWRRVCCWTAILSIVAFCLGLTPPELQCEEINDLQIVEGRGFVRHGGRGTGTDYYIESTCGERDWRNYYFCLLLNKVNNSQWVNQPVKIWHSKNYVYQFAIKDEIIYDIAIANQGIIWHNILGRTWIYFVIAILVLSFHLWTIEKKPKNG